MIDFTSRWCFHNIQTTSHRRIRHQYLVLTTRFIHVKSFSILNTQLTAHILLVVFFVCSVTDWIFRWLVIRHWTSNRHSPSCSKRCNIKGSCRLLVKGKICLFEVFTHRVLIKIVVVPIPHTSYPKRWEFMRSSPRIGLARCIFWLPHRIWITFDSIDRYYSSIV